MREHNLKKAVTESEITTTAAVVGSSARAANVVNIVGPHGLYAIAGVKKWFRLDALDPDLQEVLNDDVPPVESTNTWSE